MRAVAARGAPLPTTSCPPHRCTYFVLRAERRGPEMMDEDALDEAPDEVPGWPVFSTSMTPFSCLILAWTPEPRRGCALRVKWQ